MPIDTLANVKEAIAVSGSGDDDLLERLQASADSFVETFCGRTFAGGTFTKYHSGGAKVIFLRNYPVASVTSVKVDATREFAADTLIGTDRYVVHPDRGVLASDDGPFVPSLPGWDIGPEHFPAAVQVIYTTATDDVPDAVCQAYATLIGHWYREVKTHAATGQLNVGIATDGTTYPWGQSSGFKLPPVVLELLKPFRVPSM